MILKKLWLLDNNNS